MCHAKHAQMNEVQEVKYEMHECLYYVIKITQTQVF